MQKLALYRKYRPENFDEAVGQDHVVKVLKNAVELGKLSHAYLFCGPRGTGKTSIARILAKAINCQARKGYNPCGKCATCIGITEGRILDLIEIDAASNRGIDEIRDLREKVRFAPTDGFFKVFIIDEVHMLTKEAFNALLKTLEEPPVHAIFILATTEINKVPTTIISRCQRHDFRRIKLTEIIGQLANVAKKEKIAITDEALELIAETSEGGLRDALSILDQISSVGLEKITEEDVESVMGLAPAKVVYEVTQALLKKESKKALDVIEKSASGGMDLVVFVKSLVDFVRKLLFVKVSGVEEIEGTKEQVQKLKELADTVSVNEIIALSDSLIWAQNAFKTNVDPKAVLTILCAKNFQGEEVNAVEPEPQSATPKKEKPKTVAEAAPQVAEKKPKSQQELNGKWKHFMMECKTKNNTIFAFLRVASPELADGVLTLTFPYKFHKERMEEVKNRQFVETILEKVYGEPIELKCKLEGNHRNNKVEDVESAANILGGEVVD